MLVNRCRDGASIEQLAGTAPTADAWLAVQFPGPWGARVSFDISLPAGVRGVAIRRAHGPTDGHDVFLAVPSQSLLTTWHIPDLAALRDLNIAGVLDGSAAYDQSNRQLTLVCTNGKRDQCCAIDGRALIDQLADVPDVWECSHIGGHRFAPVVLHLPDGHVYGRVDAAAARMIAGGRIPVQYLRGSSQHPPLLQAGVAAVRNHLAAQGPHDIVSVVGQGAETVIVQTSDSSWRVHLQANTGALLRPESCGADPTSATRWDILAMVELE